MKASSFLSVKLRNFQKYFSRKNWIPDQVRDDKHVLKRIFVLGLFVVFLPVNSYAQTVSPTPTPAYVVIINQIRGESCCSAGSLENTRTQLENAVRYELPTTFVLRYDALTDPQYTELILAYQRLHPTLIQTGVMVEIIPSLIQSTNVQFSISKAKCDKLTESNNERDPSTTVGMTGESGSPIESGMTGRGDSGLEGQRAISAAEKSKDAIVPLQRDSSMTDNNDLLGTQHLALSTNDTVGEGNDKTETTEGCLIQYKGTSETWFQAQNAFTIGYALDARKVILDTLLAQYQKVFGIYPKVSSAWMIDTDSVNYLHDQYGVLTHQITREQWGTDSYTLYGGPPHYPYPASRNWIMNPDFSVEKPVTIVRQTVTDPLYNYGDTSSSYTSQPNDYMRGGRGIEYFKTLIDNAIHQQSVGFANIGLENSMDGQYQEEYALQLEYIAKLRYENKLSVVFPDTVGSVFQNHKVTTYARTDGDRQAIWITTPQYRVRVIRNNKEVSITDLRLYSKDLKDPYSSRVAKHEGYWVVPFLIDGSRWYAWKNLEKSPHKFIPVMIDFFIDSSRIVIAKNVTDFSLNTLGVLGSSPKMTGSIILNDNEGQNIADFGANTIHLPSDIVYYGKIPSSFPILHVENAGWKWMLDDKTTWSLQKSDCRGRMCTYVPAVDTSQFSRAIDEQYPYLYPESVGRELSDTYTRVSVNNTFALAGRNPVRLVLEPHDAMNFPIILDKEAEITVEPDDTAVTRLGKLVSSQQQYVDLDRSDSHKVSVNVTMNQKGKLFSVSKTVYFAPNCKKDWGYCVVRPVQGVWYVITKITDWWSGRK